MREIITLLIPLVGTSLGSAMVFLFKSSIPSKTEKALLGFASGVMIAASVWSLIIPSIDMAIEQNIVAYFPAAIGFLFGIGFLLSLDVIVPHIHLKDSNPEGIPSKFSKTTMLLLAVTIHNIPEGMAIGVAYASSILIGQWNKFISCTCPVNWYCHSEFSRRVNYLNSSLQ